MSGAGYLSVNGKRWELSGVVLRYQPRSVWELVATTSGPGRPHGDHFCWWGDLLEEAIDDGAELECRTSDGDEAWWNLNDEDGMLNPGEDARLQVRRESHGLRITLRGHLTWYGARALEAFHAPEILDAELSVLVDGVELSR